MSSLVQRQSERQGIFLIALSPFKRGAGGVKYLPLHSPQYNKGLIFGRAAPHIFDEVYNNRYMRRKYASMTPEEQSLTRRRSHNNPYNSLHSRWHTTGRSIPHIDKSCSSDRRCILPSWGRPYNCRTWWLFPTNKSRLRLLRPYCRSP